MSFLLDTDICSEYLKGYNDLANRFVQYGGRLNIWAVTLGELFSWALRVKSPRRRLSQVVGLLPLVRLIEIDFDVARRFGEIDAQLLDSGLPAPDVDLINGAAALVHGLTMVTHNVVDYKNIPGLSVVDWLAP